MAGRSWIPYTVAVVAGLAVIVGARTWVAARSDEPDARSCATTLHVTSSTEKFLLVKALAADYAKAGRTLASGGCASVAVDGFTSGAVAKAVAGGWTEDLGEGHPKPDVWLPTSSMWLDELRADTTYAGRDQLSRDWRSLAHSPMVIAMPEEMAKVLGWPAKALRWRDVLGLDAGFWARNGHPEWGRFTLAKDNPARSTSGFGATVVTYYAGAEKQADLTPADVNAQKTQDFVRQVEANVVYHPDDIMDFLRTLDQADQQHNAQRYVSAVVMQEQLVYLHNQGVPDGDPAQIGKRPGPDNKMVAILPSDGTLILDHPYVALPGLAPALSEAAADFRDFLLDPARQQRFAGIGFRNDRDEAPDGLVSTLHLGSGRAPTRLGGLDADVIAAIRTGWRQLSKRANLLLVVDESGSMKQPSGIAGQGDRMAAAKAALQGATTALNPEDTIGLWGFASDPAAPHAQLLPVTPFGDGAAFTRAVGTLQIAPKPHDNTALCDSIRDAHEYLRTHLDPRRVNAVVVLTDGRHDYPESPASCAMATLGDRLTAGDPDHLVKVFGISIGDQAQVDFPALQRVCGATGAIATDLTRDPNGLNKTFNSVFSSVSPGR